MPYQHESRNTAPAAPGHEYQARCAELVEETARLRLEIEEREQTPGHHAQREAAGLWVQYHRAMVELLVLRPPHDREAQARQTSTAHQHQRRAEYWSGMVEHLAQEVTQ